MDELGHYLRLHLTGAAGGIELFSRSENLQDPEARAVIEKIRHELRDERRQLLDIAHALGKRPAPFAGVVAKVGEKAARLKPNGLALHRTPMDDLVDLETMRIAVAGKIAGYEALMAAADEIAELPQSQLADLRALAMRQHEQISELHGRAAQRALTR